MINIDWTNIVGEDVKIALDRIVMDCVRSSKMNAFTITSAFLLSDDRIETTFNSELDAYKFAAHCGFLKSRVNREESNGLYRVEMKITIRNKFAE